MSSRILSCVFATLVFLALPVGTTAGTPTDERAKLVAIQQALRAHGPQFNGNRADAPFCTRVLGDLVGGRNLEPVPPVFEATSAVDPRLERLKCAVPSPPLGPRPEAGDPDEWKWFERRWRHVPDPARRWEPPFRLYEVDLDGKTTTGPETVLFHMRRDSDHDSPARPAGYAWLNLPTCQLQAEVPVGWYPARPGQPIPAPGPAETHLLARYRGKGGGIVVLDLLTSAPETSPAWLTLDVTRVGPGEPQTCIWSAVSPSDLPPSPPSQEAAKLQTIREALRAHGDGFDPRRPTPGCPATFRAALLQALRTGREIEPVDPTFETTDSQDPRILKLTCPFDIDDNPKVHQHQDSTVHFWSARDSGPAPYRLYHVDLDGNPANGSETVFAYTQGGTAASTVYTWVDVPRCWRRALRSVGGSLSPDTARTHLLVRYRGRTLVLLLETASPGSAEPGFTLATLPFTWDRPGRCTWTSGATGTPSGAR